MAESTACILLSSHHDSWVNLAGKIIGGGCYTFDSAPHIYYRVHEDNTSGFTTSKIKKTVRDLKLYLEGKHPRRDVFAQELRHAFNDYVARDSYADKTLKLVAVYRKSLRNKIRLCKSNEIASIQGKMRWFEALCVMLGKW